jgi:hypothetical protein
MHFKLKCTSIIKLVEHINLLIISKQIKYPMSISKNSMKLAWILKEHFLQTQN